MNADAQVTYNQLSLQSLAGKTGQFVERLERLMLNTLRPSEKRYEKWIMDREMLWAREQWRVCGILFHVGSVVLPLPGGRYSVTFYEMESGRNHTETITYVAPCNDFGERCSLDGALAQARDELLRDPK